MDVLPATDQAQWQQNLIANQKKARELFSKSPEERKEQGYFHTLQEICQQPWAWLRTCELMLESAEQITKSLQGVKSVIFTGSGSSEYAGECVRLPVQRELGLTVESIGGGTLLLQGAKVLPPAEPGLLVSLARSGNSPESSGVVKLLLESVPAYRHLVMTCNEGGSLARESHGNPNVRVIALPPETNDQSLVMTSSFTSLLLAARFLGLAGQPEEYRKFCRTAAAVAQKLIEKNFDALAKLAAERFARVAFLGSGTRYPAAREAALKMVEMTSGAVPVIFETYLGLRHGPMSFLRDDTLVVCQLSSDAMTRAYEVDLLKELGRKKLGLCKAVIGADIPETVVEDGDTVVECAGVAELKDEDSAVIYVVVAQLLAFFRCLEEGLKPDSPSEDGVINRVVETFPLHKPL